MKFSGLCPACGEHLHLARLKCPGCKAEFPTDEPLLPYNYLSEEEAQFLKIFLSCRGSLKDVQAKLNISYPTAKKRLEELLLRLGLCSEDEDEEVDMSLFRKTETVSTKASDIIRNKLYDNGGKATVRSVSGKQYVIRAGNNGKTFLCNELPIKPPFSYEVFDHIVELLIRRVALPAKAWDAILGWARVTAPRTLLSVTSERIILRPTMGLTFLTLCLCWPPYWSGPVLPATSGGICP